MPILVLCNYVSCFIKKMSTRIAQEQMAVMRDKLQQYNLKRPTCAQTQIQVVCLGRFIPFDKALNGCISRARLNMAKKTVLASRESVVYQYSLFSLI